MNFRILLLSLILAGLPLSLAEASTKQLSYVMCRSQKVVRTIRVVDADEGCQTVYTKSGVDKIVGSAKQQVACMEVLQNIRGNLEGAAWKCKDISSAAVSTVNN